MPSDIDVFGGEDDSAENVETSVLNDPPENIPIQDDDDDDSDSSEAEEARPPRKERRANRFRALSEEVKELRRKLEERSHEPQPPPQYYPPPPQNQGGEEDGISPELQAVYDKQLAITREYESLSAEEQHRRHAEFYKKAQRIDVEKQRIIALDAAAVTSDYAERNAMKRMLRAQHADVFNWKHPNAPRNSAPTGGAYFESVWKRMVQVEMLPDTQETMNRALAETRKALRLRGDSSPSDSVKAKLTGAPRGGASVKDAKSFPMTKDYKRLAKAAYPHLPEEKAYKKWVQTTGRSLLEGDD